MGLIPDKDEQEMVRRALDPKTVEARMLRQAMASASNQVQEQVRSMLHQMIDLVPGQLFRDIGRFHEKFELKPTDDPGHRLPDDVLKFRIKFMFEELQEYVDAIGGTWCCPGVNVDSSKFDVEKAFDALIDLVYVALGTAFLHRFPFNEGWDRVQAAKTHTTKANVATALQMISWGLEVNDYGNAQLDADGNFIKVKGEGVTEEMWAEVVAYADDKGWKKGDYKNLNLPFESKFLAQPAEIRERMAQRVEDFVYKMLTEVLGTADTAPLAVEAILAAGSYDLGAKVGRLEDPADWTDAKIVERAKSLDTDKGAAGNFDD